MDDRRLSMLRRLAKAMAVDVKGLLLGVTPMTEAQWLGCTKPGRMISFMGNKVSPRKRRVFACACCHRIAHLLPDEQARQELQTIERNVESGFSKEEHEAAWAAIVIACSESPGPPWAVRAILAAKVGGWFGASGAAQNAAVDHDPSSREAEIQCSLLRDIIGNPFRSVIPDAAWSHPSVLADAKAIYDERALDRMPILADALEDAGCHQADILEHCRGGGEHVRGCWVVDLLLGKT